MSMENCVSIVEAPTVKKHMTRFYAINMLFGTMIGSGIFITVDNTFAMFKDTPIMLVSISWFVAGVVALMGALCYAELASRIPESGGEMVYFRKCLSSSFSRTFAIFFYCGIRPLSIAALALTFGKYIVVTVDPSSKGFLAQRIFAAAAVFIWLGVNCLSKRLVNLFGVVLCNLKLLAIAIIVGCGIYKFSTKPVPEWKAPFKTSGLNMPNTIEAVKEFAWSFEGWNTLGVVAGEMANPAKDVPIALTTGVILVSVCYVLCVISYSAILGYDVVKVTKTLGSSVADVYLGAGRPILPLLIAFSAFGSVNYDIFANGIIGLSAGHSGELPKIFALVHRRTRIPIVSLIVCSVIVFFMLPMSLEALIGYVAFLSWACYFFAFVVLWILKLKARSQSKGGLKIFVIPYPFIAFMQLVCLCVVVLCFYDKPIGCSIVSAFAVAFFALQHLPHRWFKMGFLASLEGHIAGFLMRTFDLEYASHTDVLA